MSDCGFSHTMVWDYFSAIHQEGLSTFYKLVDTSLTLWLIKIPKIKDGVYKICEPTLIEYNFDKSKLIQIECGYSHSLFLTQKKE